MSNIQPGSGYTFSASSSGFTIDIDTPFINYDSVGDKGGISLEMLAIYPFKIVKHLPANEGSWTELLAYLALSALELTPYSLIPETGPQFKVLPGTINGTVCFLDWTACADGSPTQNIYLQTYPEGDEQIIATTDVLTDSDDESYVLLGTVDYSGKTPIILNSLVMERFKCGDTPAVYWYSKM
jgi:hypothetical protein